MASVLRTIPALFGLVSWSAGLRAQSPTAILGDWRGSSVCVKASWNAACNDEVIEYHVVADSAHAGQVILHAFKLVNGAPDWMGDLDLAWDSTAAAWAGDFQNSRVHVRWSYRVQGDSLTGQVVNLATGQVGRHVRGARIQKAP